MMALAASSQERANYDLQTRETVLIYDKNNDVMKSFKIIKLRKGKEMKNKKGEWKKY
jgi:hypothetical protein